MIELPNLNFQVWSINRLVFSACSSVIVECHNILIFYTACLTMCSTDWCANIFLNAVCFCVDSWMLKKVLLHFWPRHAVALEKIPHLPNLLSHHWTRRKKKHQIKWMSPWSVPHPEEARVVENQGVIQSQASVLFHPRISHLWCLLALALRKDPMHQTVTMAVLVGVVENRTVETLLAMAWYLLLRTVSSVAAAALPALCALSVSLDLVIRDQHLAVAALVMEIMTTVTPQAQWSVVRDIQHLLHHHPV